MAKKIRLDFSKTEERSGWNTRGIPEGLHKMKIEAVQETEAQDGTAMLVYALVPADPKLKTRRFPFYCKLQANQLWKLRDLLVAAGISVPKKALNIDPASPVGKMVAAEVEDETGQYAGRSSVNAIYGLDILDEDDSPTVDEDSDDEDEEEYEEEADEAEDEGEEEEDELDTLTLPELRKRAKSLGIDTAGVKKDELIDLIREEEGEAEEEDAEEDEDELELDEDDLDDEELEDEDFDDEEDEEEEPEPAPKRRATPTRKPAKAATVKRTVKRR